MALSWYRKAAAHGNEFDVIEGRGGNGEPVRKTPWGEIACHPTP